MSFHRLTLKYGYMVRVRSAISGYMRRWIFNCDDGIGGTSGLGGNIILSNNDSSSLYRAPSIVSMDRTGSLTGGLNFH